MEYKDVINFWFEETTPEQWFIKSEKFDQEICNRFLKTYELAALGKTKVWRDTPEGRLAEIIVLDQFPRNMFRGSPKAFATDPMALTLAQEARRLKEDKKLDGQKRYFMYMPYMHSESTSVHKKAFWLFLSLPLKSWWSWIKFEYKHKKIIDRFGRYPHRNDDLGRVSTPEELEFLEKNPGF